MARLRFTRQSSEPAATRAGDGDPADEWKQRALGSVGLWLLVDRRLQVLDASDAARAYFGISALPASLITITRSAAIERFARRGVEGEGGPWELDAAHFRGVMRVRAVPATETWTMLVLEDITEMRRLEAMRADFVANLAHELRTPIASLSLAAETLSADLPPREQRRFIERIAEETRYIEGLLKSVAELALLESDVSLSVTEFALRDVVEESWRRVTDRQGPGDLENNVHDELLILGDRIRVSEVLQNLLENAQRFSPPGQTVRVRAIPLVDGGVEVGIEDRGPGIPPVELPRVFERFYKVDRARTRRGDGSGLGLAISKHLVSAHGGRIWAEAVEEGGTRIVFTLPRLGVTEGGSDLTQP